MARDAETGELLSDADLWHSGYAVGYILLPRASVYEGLNRDELVTREIDALLAGYSAGVRDRKSEMAAELAAPVPAPTGDEIPY
jgi:hypothetical protein